MERLTQLGYKYHSCDFMEDGVYEWANQLSAYEDTGLTPEQIRELAERDAAKRYVRQKCQECIFLVRKTIGKRGGIRGYCRIRYPNEQRVGSSTACQYFEKDYEED